MARSNVKLPRDGFLRTESSNWHIATIQRRDKVAEALRNSGLKPPYSVQCRGTSVIKVYCSTYTQRFLFQQLLEQHGVKEIHFSKMPVAYTNPQGEPRVEMCSLVLTGVIL